MRFDPTHRAERRTPHFIDTSLEAGCGRPDFVPLTTPDVLAVRLSQSHPFREHRKLERDAPIVRNTTASALHHSGTAVVCLGSKCEELKVRERVCSTPMT